MYMLFILIVFIVWICREGLLLYIQQQKNSDGRCTVPVVQRTVPALWCKKILFNWNKLHILCLMDDLSKHMTYHSFEMSISLC